MMKYSDVKSLLINTVHDSIVVDAHPDEIETMTKLLDRATKDVIDSLYEFYISCYTLKLIYTVLD